MNLLEFKEFRFNVLILFIKNEEFLLNVGFNQLRVRVHGKIARIEVLPEDFIRIIKMHEKISAYLKDLGFDYVTLDLQGYRVGSMNEPHFDIRWIVFYISAYYKWKGKFLWKKL